ncbi:MAG: hypothetical protein LBM04_00435, partial [Opitutaceae bacterium]|nr:hypothetical protein [Opitutaceae bacterium]
MFRFFKKSFVFYRFILVFQAFAHFPLLIHPPPALTCPVLINCTYLTMLYVRFLNATPVFIL